jgi:hypothetical protein
MKYVFLVLFLWNCSRNDVVRGSNSSETENTISAQIVSSTNHPLAMAQISFVLNSAWDSLLALGEVPVTHKVTTNENGLLQLSCVQGQEYTALYQGELAGFFEVFICEDNSFVFKTKQQGLLTINAQGVLQDSVMMCLEYTSWCAFADAFGNYVFEKVPNAQYYPVLVHAKNVASLQKLDYPIHMQSNVLNDSIYVAKDTLWLDDFEDGDNNGLLYNWNLTAKWWIYHVNASSAPMARSDFGDYIITDALQLENNVLEFTVEQADSANSLALLGLDLGMGNLDSLAENNFADLSNMSALRFKMKGTGLGYVFLQTKQTLQLGEEEHLYASFPLTGDWQTVRLTPEQFKPIVGSLADNMQLDFEAVASRVSAIVFQFTEPGTTWIDDLGLEGIHVMRMYNWQE